MKQTRMLFTGAMEVLKKCAERIQTTIEIFYLRDIGWTVQTFHPEKPRDLIKAVAETLELAICLAAKLIHSK